MLLWPVEWVVYCNDSYNSKSTTINFAFDTKTGCSWNSNIQFTNQYGYNSMVDYNPRERVLYARDNRRLVTYPITEIWETLSSLCDQQVLGLKNADQQRFALRRRWQVRVVLGKRGLLCKRINKQLKCQINQPRYSGALTLQKPTVTATSKQWIPKLIFSSLWLQYNL